MRSALNSSSSIQTSEIGNPVMSVKCDRLCLGRTEDVKARIASALCVGQREIEIDRCRYGPSRVMARCTGNWKGKRFFAKILLADPFPVPARFTVPWEVPNGTPRPTRPVGDQIEIEWNMSLKMRSLSGGECVPAPLGRSVSARTIVWEEAYGKPLVWLVKRTRWKRSIGATGSRKMFEAGEWLRRVHEASHQRDETVNMVDLIDRARNFARQKGPQISDYDRVVPRILEAALPTVGKGCFAVPVAFTHGDFCLANLLWDGQGGSPAVIDFELSGVRNTYRDLFALVGSLQSALLNPFIPKSVILAWERSFWRGYGPISSQLKDFVRALALARVFYHHLSRFHKRRESKGWISRVHAQLYRNFMEPKVIANRLDLPQFLKDFS
jgi:Phosphotransferase enzyme family